MIMIANLMYLNFSTQISVQDSHWSGPKEEVGKHNPVFFFLFFDTDNLFR